MVKYCAEEKTRIAIIEPNPIEREYLLALVCGAPGVTLAETCSSLGKALPELEQTSPDIVIVDIDGDNGYVTTWLKELHTSLPNAAVLVLSAEKNREHLFEALEAGVSGWLQKPCSADQILHAIDMLQRGGAVLSSSVARKILQYFQARGSSVRDLSRREREILSLVGQGLQPAEIAEKLGLSHSLVRTDVKTILLKLKASSRAEAVAKYLNPTP